MSGPRTTRHRMALYQAAVLLTLPVAVLLVDFDSAALAGCGSYGYGCTAVACVTLEVTTDSGSSWQQGSAWIYGPQGATIDVFVRTTLSVSLDKVEGWSFGVRHTAPTLGANGGSFTLNAVEAGADVATLQSGGPPDFEATRAWTCGYTQGLFIDLETGDSIGPASEVEVAVACYRVTFPYDSAVHDVTLELTDDVGDPPVETMLTRRGGEGVDPCPLNLTLHVQSTSSPATPSFCPIDPTTPWGCP